MGQPLQHGAASMARDSDERTHGDRLQSLWQDARSQGALCPRDGGRMALAVAENPRGHVYRLCCVGCGWCTAFFVVEGKGTAPF